MLYGWWLTHLRIWDDPVGIIIYQNLNFKDVVFETCLNTPITCSIDDRHKIWFGDFIPSRWNLILDRGFPPITTGITQWKAPRDQSCSVSARPSELVCVEAPMPISCFDLQRGIQHETIENAQEVGCILELVFGKILEHTGNPVCVSVDFKRRTISVWATMAQLFSSPFFGVQLSIFLVSASFPYKASIFWGQMQPSKDPHPCGSRKIFKRLSIKHDIAFFSTILSTLWHRFPFNWPSNTQDYPCRLAALLPLQALLWEPGRMFFGPCAKCWSKTSLKHHQNLSQPCSTCILYCCKDRSTKYVTTWYDGFRSMGVSPVIILILDWDFPWNIPSSYWGSTIDGNPRSLS